jgi:hypothetical protein
MTEIWVEVMSLWLSLAASGPCRGRKKRPHISAGRLTRREMGRGDAVSGWRKAPAPIEPRPNAP